MEQSFEVLCQVGNDASVLWGFLKNFYNSPDTTDREKRLIELSATLLNPIIKAVGDPEIVRSATEQNLSGILDGTRKVSIHMKGTHVELKDSPPGQSS